MRLPGRVYLLRSLAVAWWSDVQCFGRLCAVVLMAAGSMSSQSSHRNGIAPTSYFLETTGGYEGLDVPCQGSTPPNLCIKGPKKKVGQ
jgi:hypothetical protein